MNTENNANVKNGYSYFKILKIMGKLNSKHKIHLNKSFKIENNF